MMTQFTGIVNLPVISTGYVPVAATAPAGRLSIIAHAMHYYTLVSAFSLSLALTRVLLAAAVVAGNTCHWEKGIIL